MFRDIHKRFQSSVAKDLMMWAKRLYNEFKDLQLHFCDVTFELDRYERLHKEFLELGREQLLFKYRHTNLTYVYKYLNTNIYQQSREDYRFVYEKLEVCRSILEFISVFTNEFDSEEFEVREVYK